MRRYLHILFSFLVFIAVGHRALPQNPYDLPMACVGTVEEYWVKGFNGASDFQWRILNADGEEVSTNYYTVINNGDSILVNWSPQLPGGIYTFEVIEHSHLGCTGEPYTQDIVLNSSDFHVPLEFVNEFFQVCQGNTAALEPGDFINYLWTIDNSTAPVYYTGEAGTYEVRLYDSDYSCSFHDIELKVNPLPVVDLGKDTTLFGGQTMVLNVYDPTFSNYEWSTGATSASIIVEGGYGDQFIWVVVTDDNGCTNSDSINVYAEDLTKLRIPKAFMPDTDGENRTWKFPAPKPPYYIDNGLWTYLNDVDVLVYNRWGKLVWKSSGPFKEWDGRDLGGRPLPMDSYHYIIRITVDGKTFNYKGSVTIIR